MIFMKKIQKCTNSTRKNVQKTSKTPIIVPKPDITSLKTSQDISLVNIYSFLCWALVPQICTNAFFFDICGVTYGTIFHKNCLVKALLLKSSQCKTCLIKI